MSKTATKEIATTAIRTSTSDHVADAAHTLAIITDGRTIENDQSWTVTHPRSQRQISISAIDGEWNAGVEIHIFNRSGAVIGRATIQVMGMSPHFIAEMASDLNREIR